MADFFSSQLDYIYFFYGFSFIMLAVICFTLPASARRSFPWHWLGLFGLFHGLHKWFDLFSISFTLPAFVAVCKTALFVIAYSALFEFGRRSLNRFLKHPVSWWVQIPFWGCVFVALAFGKPEADAVVRYVVALPAAAASAAALFLAGQQKNGGHISLRIAAVIMGLYAIAFGLIVTAEPFIPARDINSSFFNLTGFPIELLRSLLMLSMTVALWSYSLHHRQVENSLLPPLHSRAPHTLLTIILLAFLLPVGWLTTDMLGREAESQLIRHGKEDIKLIISSINNDLEEVNNAVRILGNSEIVADELALSSNKGKSRLDGLLDDFQSIFHSSTSFIMDKSGKVIATTNRNPSTSGIGRNYAFRPYFNEAIKGQQSSYFALGMNVKDPGYYAAYPVRVNDSRIVGVAGIKLNLVPLEKMLSNYPHAYMIDSYGIVFLSSQPGQRNASLWPIKEEIRRKIAESQQYSDISSFKPLFPREITDRSLVKINESEHMATRFPLNEEGWSVVLLNPTHLISIYRLFGIGATLVLVLIIIGIFATWQIMDESSSRIYSSEQLYKTLIYGSPNIVGLFDDKGSFLAINPAGVVAFRMENETGDGKTLLDVWPEKSRQAVAEGIQQALSGSPASFDAELDNADGSSSSYLVVLNPLKEDNGDVHQFVGICTDISEKKAAEVLMQHQAMYDMLTELPNRLLFHNELSDALRTARKFSKQFAVLFLDLDNLKTVNDTLGHAAGDELLKAVARRLQSKLRSHDVISRRGGDEFTILLPEYRQETDVEIVCDKIKQTFAEPFLIGEESVNVTTSFGVALYPKDGKSADTLLLHADAALYYVKEHGRNNYRFYQPGDMRSSAGHLRSMV